MRKLTIPFWLGLLAVMLSASVAEAQVVTRDDALSVARRWIAHVTAHHGNWSGSKQASVENVIEWTYGKHMLGYFCIIKPHGFILVPPRRELGVVKAYSAESDLDPYDDGGMADLLRIKMEGIVKAIEDSVGPVPTVSTQALESILEFSYRQNWDNFDSPTDQNYQEGDTLLETRWHQNYPYNEYCPEGHNGCTNAHCAVGCVATAGAQIMRYWCWPPDRGYDWPNMPDGRNWNWTQPQIDAVATLCHNVGEEVGMDYCVGGNQPCGSGANECHILSVFSANSYSDGDCQARISFSQVGWFNAIVEQINKNQPMEYGIPDHSIVCDGWKIDGLGRQYHINYGWGGSFTQWYTIDNIHGGFWPQEELQRNVHPQPSIGPNMTGQYSWNLEFPYYYVCEDAVSTSPSGIDPGNRVQFLPKVTMTAGANAPIRISGRPLMNQNLLLFTRGDQTKGILIRPAGTLVLSNGGQIKFR